MIFGLELIILEKGKNAGIRPLVGENRRLGGGGLIPAYYCMLEQGTMMLIITPLYL